MPALIESELASSPRGNINGSQTRTSIRREGVEQAGLWSSGVSLHLQWQSIYVRPFGTPKITTTQTAAGAQSS
jgi:hypothetical protein